MPRFKYKAKNLDSKVSCGVLQAEDFNDAYEKINLSGYYPIYLEEVHDRGKKKVLKSRYLADFSRQIGTMMSSGIPLVQAMNILRKRETNRTLAHYYDNIHGQLLRGTFLSEALEEQEEAFPVLLISMFKAGEAGGRLADAALRMADYYEKDNKLRRKLDTALMYPAFLMMITVAALITIFTVVLPNFFDMFASLESLPLSTRILYWISTNLRRYFVEFLAVTAAGTVLLAGIARTPSVSLMTDKMKTRLPASGRLMRTIYTSRFARTLSTLYASGVPLAQCVKIAGGVIDNKYIEMQFGRVLEDVCNGMAISMAISSVDGFDKKLATNIYIGEEAGSLDTMLESMADSFDYEAEQAAQKIVALIEPVMIVVMAVVIGYIMLSVMVPVYQYYENIG